jgi:predicted transposase YbfD/YdcC
VDRLSPTRSESDEASLPGLAMIGMIEATVERPDGTSFERRFYVSSSPLPPERFAELSRAHWKIENSLHRVLDTRFDEDRAGNRCDHGPDNLIILRKLALNMLQSARPDISVRRKRKRSGWSDEFAGTIFGRMR